MYQMRRVLLFALAVCLFDAGVLRAGTVFLKNGDRITGAITRVGPKEVRVKTAYAGTLTIPLADIKTLASAAPVVRISPRQPAQMVTLTPAPGGAGWIATPVNIPVPPAALSALPKAKPVSWFGPAWENELDLGMTNTAGNSNSTQATGALSLHYHLEPDDVNLSFTGGYGVTNGVQALGYAQSDEIWRRALNEFKPAWAKRVFFFAENNDRYDAILGLSLRANNDLGLGYYLLDSKTMELDIRGGPGYTYEKFFHCQSTRYANGTAGLHFQYQINSHLQFIQTITYISSLENGYNYQASATSALSFDLPQVSRGFGLRASFTDNYDNTAGASGRKRNDTLILGSVFFKF